MVIGGPVLRRNLGRTAVGVAVAALTSLAAACIAVFVDTEGWTANSLPGDVTVTELLAVLVIVFGTFVAAAVAGAFDDRGGIGGASFGCYLVATSTGSVAFAFGYVWFWCERATAVVTRLVDQNQDVLHWSARVSVPGTSQHKDFDHYSREGEGVAIGHEFAVIVDPRGWTGPSEPFPVEVFQVALGVTLALYLALFLIATARARREQAASNPSGASGE
jgi:hypothetical protein